MAKYIQPGEPCCGTCEYWKDGSRKPVPGKGIRVFPFRTACANRHVSSLTNRQAADAPCNHYRRWHALDPEAASGAAGRQTHGKVRNVAKKVLHAATVLAAVCILIFLLWNQKGTNETAAQPEETVRETAEEE